MPRPQADRTENMGQLLTCLVPNSYSYLALLLLLVYPKQNASGAFFLRLHSRLKSSWAREGEGVPYSGGGGIYLWDHSSLPAPLAPSTIGHFPLYKFSEPLCRNINLPILVGGA